MVQHFQNCANENANSQHIVRYGLTPEQCAYLTDANKKIELNEISLENV